jgi:F-type H+-transporting ATPase subunit b
MLAVSIFQSLGLNPAVLGLQALVFLVLLWLLRRFLFGPVQQIMRARELEVQQHLDQARDHQTTAERIRDELQQRLDTIQEEARRRMREVADEAKAARDTAVAEARAEAERLLQRAASEIDLEKRKAIADLREQVADLALSAASKAIQETLDESTQRRVIDQAISSLEQRQ